jgi:MFS family permease
MLNKFLRKLSAENTKIVTNGCIRAAALGFIPDALYGLGNQHRPAAIGAEFGVSAVTLGWIATAYLLTATVFLVPLGKVADIYGRRRIFLIGILIFTISSTLCGISGSIGMLITMRILQGIGSPMIFGTGVAILTSVYPSGEKGKALGINTAAVYLGLPPVRFRWFFDSSIRLGSIFFQCRIRIRRSDIGRWKLQGEWAEANERLMAGALIYAFLLVI